MTNGKDDNEKQSKPGDKTDSSTDPPEENLSDYGYDLYPERRGGKLNRGWIASLFGIGGRPGIDKLNCEENVYWCVKNSPLIKLMMAALKSSGCAIDIRRHISCESCDLSETMINGGYDPMLNQIVICQNARNSKAKTQGILTHEMIHMFDYCNNDVDFRNMEHLACTEIRAANLTHCSFLSAVTQGDASFFNVRERHKECVKNKALHSVIAVRKVSPEDARAVIDRVFPKCYNDLEPIGRRVRRNSPDIKKAYLEGPLYGYNI